MRDVSQNIRDAINAEVIPRIHIKMYWGNGTNEYITNLVEGSITRRRGCSEGGDFMPFSPNISSFEFSFYDDDDFFNTKEWTDAKFTVQLAYTYQNISELISFGTYYVGSHTKSGQTVQVTGYDAMVYLDRQKLSGSDFDTQYPKIPVILDKIVQNTPLTAEYDSNNLQYYGLKLTADTEMTKRQLLAECMKVVFGMAYVDDNQKLVFAQLAYTRIPSTRTWRTVDQYLGDLVKFSEDISPIMICGFRFSDENGMMNTRYVGDSDSGYIIDIPSSVYTSTSGNQPLINDAIYNMYVGSKILPGTIITLNDPTIEPGDRYATTQTGYIDEFMVSQLTWKYGSTRMTLQCDANPEAMQDLRSTNGESQYDNSNFQYLGTVALQYGAVGDIHGPQIGAYIKTDGIVPAKYRRAYTVGAVTTTSGAHVTSVTTAPAGFTILGDTDGMQVQYLVMRDRGTAQTTSSGLTNFGALAQQHISDIEGDYTR